MASIGDMSTPAKLGLATGGTAALAGSAYAFFRDTNALWIILGGILFVVILLLLYWAILKRIDWRKALRLENVIPTGANTKGLTPQEVADLAAARKAFAEGVEKFRANGKSLTKVPWYVVVGESGGGKSEAIRRSNIPFIPGLTNKLQGVGGTVNMNWWFTRDAVLLDTAGKWMMEDTSGWEAFLQHLTTNRPECPINGLLLMVPAPSLISDNIPGALGAGGGPKMTLTQKAEHIASQFERMQTTLGIRFPVYVLVTKCDLIEGFNEFFGDLKDGHEINQILGWSNPASLDEPFRPDLVDEHLKVVRERLLRRRLRLLQNPVNSDDPTRVRTEQVDALYTLPDSLTQIGPRLKQFLDTIFVAGTFSERPLFLRGIYFTSSMQEGAPWDLDLATAMGIPAEALPTGKVQGGERAYFLRDLFLEKVFHERGLVTKAADVNQAHRRRKALLMTSGIAATLLLIGATVFSFYSLNAAIGGARDLWRVVAGDGFDTREWAAVRQGREAYATSQQPNRESNLTIIQALERSTKFSEKPIDVPKIFKLTGRGNINLQPANASLVQLSVTRPLVQTARQMLKQNEKWDDDSSAQLVQLVRMEGASSTTQPAEPIKPEVFDSLFEYVLKENKPAAEKYRDQKTTVRDLLQWTLNHPGQFGGVKYWTGAGTREAQEALDAAINRYVAFSTQQVADNAALEQFKSLTASLKEFQAAQQNLSGDPNVGYDPAPKTMDEYREKHALWSRNYAALQQAAMRIDESRAKLAVEGADMLGAFEKRVSETAARQLHGLEQLRLATESGSSEFLKRSNTKVTTAMAAIEKNNKDEADKLKESLAKFQKLYLDASTDQKVPHYQAQLAVCKSVNDVLEPAPEVVAGADADAVWSKANDRLRVLEKLQRDVAAQVAAQAAHPSPPVVDAGAPQPPQRDAWSMLVDALNRSVLPNMAGPLLRYEAASVIFAWPGQAQDWEARVSELSSDPKHQQAEDSAARKFRKRPRVPMTVADVNFDARYHPPIVKGLIDLQSQVERYLKPDTKEPPLDRDKLAGAYSDHQTAFDEYVNLYLDYWGSTVVQELQISARTWNDFTKDIAQTRADRVQDALRTLSDRITDAAKTVGERGATLETRISKTRDIFEGRSFEVACKTALDKWQRLTREADPRAMLLDLKPEQFKDYECGVDPEDTFLVFWASLPRVGLRCIADQAAAQLQADLAALQGLERFPLVLPKGAAGALQQINELTPAEVDKARAIVTRLLGTEAKVGVLAMEDTGNKDFDKELRRMRTKEVIDAQQFARLSMMRAVLDALPRAGRGLRCTVIARKGASDGFRWPHGTLKQAGSTLQKDVTLRGDDQAEEIGDALLPGGPLTFEFGNFVVGNRQVALQVPVGDAKRNDQWGILRLLLDPACNSAGGGQEHGRAWVMVFRAPRPNDQQVITLQINFNGNAREGMFPSRAEWETLRVGAAAPAVAPAPAIAPAPAPAPAVAPPPIPGAR